MKSLVAKDILNTDVITVLEDMTVHELAALFTEKMISGAPVVNADGKVIGVVSLSDIVRSDQRRSEIIHSVAPPNSYLQEWGDTFDSNEMQELHLEIDDGLAVRDIMTPFAFQVQETTSVQEMADIMISGRIHRLIVTRDERMVGIVTSLDMLKIIATPGVTNEQTS